MIVLYFYDETKKEQNEADFYMSTYQTDPTLQIEPQAFSKQSHQFWTLQIAGWVGYAVVVFIAIIRPQFEDPNFNLSGQIINLLIETLSGFALSYVLWLVIRRTVHFPLKKTLFISFTSAAVLGLVFNIIKLASYKTVVYNQVWYQQLNMLEFGGWFLFSVATLFIWTAIFFIMLYNTKLQKEHESLLLAQNSAKEAQLQMLRYQLNPHFMFNTLNAISTLIYKKDNDKAGEMLDKLCAFFRYSLEQNKGQLTSLKKELELLELYLSIEKVRFGQKLKVEMNIEPAIYHTQVPALFLQPIVENAIKYGIEMNKENGTISIKASQMEDMLEVLVVDEGGTENQQKAQGFGIGLNNTKERLKTMFGNMASLEIEQSSNTTSVRIIMPNNQGARYDG